MRKLINYIVDKLDVLAAKLVLAQDNRTWTQEEVEDELGCRVCEKF